MKCASKDKTDLYQPKITFRCGSPDRDQKTGNEPEKEKASPVQLTVFSDQQTLLTPNKYSAKFVTCLNCNQFNFNCKCSKEVSTSRRAILKIHGRSMSLPSRSSSCHQLAPNSVTATAILEADELVNHLNDCMESLDDEDIKNLNFRKRHLLVKSPDPMAPVKVVIFDKDGTLICFDSMWIPWVTSLIERLEKETGMAVAERLEQMFGYDSKHKKVRMGMLAESAMPVIRHRLETFFAEQCFMGKEAAKQLMKKTWQDCDPSNPANIKPITELSSLFQKLHDKNMKVAVCTSDTHNGASGVLQALGVLEQVDMLVCSDHEDTRPKPSPYNIFKICRQFLVHPQQVVMIGDTKADLEMARAAAVRHSIAVLSGIGRREELSPLADIVIDSVAEEHLLPILQS